MIAGFAWFNKTGSKDFWGRSQAGKKNINRVLWFGLFYFFFFFFSQNVGHKLAQRREGSRFLKIGPSLFYIHWSNKLVLFSTSGLRGCSWRNWSSRLNYNLRNLVLALRLTFGIKIRLFHPWVKFWIIPFVFQWRHIWEGFSVHKMRKKKFQYFFVFVLLLFWQHLILFLPSSSVESNRTGLELKPTFSCTLPALLETNNIL